MIVGYLIACLITNGVNLKDFNMLKTFIKKHGSSLND
ncbi:hypothetical protein LSGJ_00199 [Ligilactobacillus salivarius GJ-24]|uniref:Uncharacterized protein n=1 Tax=Ligilactobacillus salivarius GJ-24 TaxID=1041521 RepID=F7QSG4_9LACO|nr:hypothetical protein LSGJ_00199 [Ligilactobacillus salivarius GJ-24]